DPPPQPLVSGRVASADGRPHRRFRARERRAVPPPAARRSLGARALPGRRRARGQGRLSRYPCRAVWAWIAIVAALVAYGLLLRWLGGFEGAGSAIERWGNHCARRWASKHGIERA